MISGRKAMAAVMDAMLFLIILGIAASAMFVYENENEMPLAETIHRDLFRTELRADDIFDIDDSRVFPIKDIIAAHILSGGGNIERYIYDVLRSMVPVSHGFVFRCEFKGASMMIGEYSGDMTSYYGSEHNVADGILYSYLTIF